MFADDAARLLPVLAGTLTPSLEEWQVNDQREKVLRESEALENTPQAQVVEALHREAFRAQPLGRPLYCPSYNVHRITESVLQAYAAEHYVPRDALLVGVGFEHEELMGLAERAFGGVVARSEKTGAPASKYVGGGEVVMPGEPTHGVHVAIAYEGVPRGSPDEPALQVLQQVLGRSVRRTLGKLPPGHGTTNRLAEGLLVRHPSVEAASAFSYSYDSTGLFGVYAQGSRPDLLPALAAELSALRSLSDEEVETAKRRARAHLLFGLEYRGTFLDWVASRALRGLDLLAPEQLAASIDQLPPQRVRSLAERILSGRPTLAAFGDVANLPRL
jgi:processing peptidase subunit alpha